MAGLEQTGEVVYVSPGQASSTMTRQRELDSLKRTCQTSGFLVSGIPTNYGSDHYELYLALTTC